MSRLHHEDYYVYILFDENGNPFYVGKGRADWCDAHRAKSKRVGHRGLKINKVLNVLGEIPTVKVRENLTNEQALEIEAAFILAIGRGRNGPLVNQTDGGQAGPGQMSDEAKKSKGEKISIAKKGKVVISEEQKKQISEALTGRRLTEEQRQKRRGRKLTEEHKSKIRGFKHSEEFKERRRRELTGIKRPSEYMKAALAATTDQFCQMSTKEKYRKASK